MVYNYNKLHKASLKSSYCVHNMLNILYECFIRAFHFKVSECFIRESALLESITLKHTMALHLFYGIFDTGNTMGSW